MTEEIPEITQNPTAAVASSVVEPPGGASLSGVGDAAPPAATVQGETSQESTPKLAESLLEQFDREEKAKIPEPATPSADAKPAESPKEGEKPADPAVKDSEKPAAPAEPAALAPIDYAYKLPETITLGDGDKEKVHSAFDAFRADPAKGAQALIDLHNDRMQAFADATLQRQYDTFNDTRKAWVKEVMSDPDLGGSGFRTAMGVVARVRDMFVPESRREGFERFLRITGAGDHPEFLRFLHSVGRAFDEPPATPSIGKPTPTQGLQQRRTLRDTYNKPT